MTEPSLISHSRPWITAEDRKSVLAVLKSGMISNGNITSQFELEIARYLGASHGISPASGTAALVLALKTINIGQGDEVVIPTYVCRSVMDAVLSVVASPQLCDVDTNGVITVETVAPVITERTKAIIAVHIFGNHCNIAALNIFGVSIIEDACQSFGMTHNGVFSGVMGDLGVLSFHATKPITTGEGGMLVTNKPSLGLLAKDLASEDPKPSPKLFAPMSDLQAALGLSQLTRYSDFIHKRNILLQEYVEVIKDAGLKLATNERTDMPFRFVIQSNLSFACLQEQFLQCGIVVRKGVDQLLHRLIGIDDANFLTAVQLFQTTISVPFYPGLTNEESQRVKKSLGILSLS